MAGRGNPLVNNKATLAELEAELEVIKAKIASTKAKIQEDKAEVASNNAADERNLKGNRDKDGNLITDYADATSRFYKEEDINQMSTDEMIDANIPVQESKVLLVDDDTKTRKHNISGVDLPLEEEEEKASIRDVTDERPMNLPGIDVDGDDEEMVTDKQIAEEWIAGKAKPESTKPLPEKDTDGRRKATEIENLRGEKPGYEIAKDGNYWSVNEKDDYWKTEEGYEEAMNLYGSKPSWLKAEDVGTLVYNPSTGEYEEVEQEEFEGLKPYKKRISL